MKTVAVVLCGVILVAAGSVAVFAIAGGSQQPSGGIVYFTHPENEMTQVGLVPAETLSPFNGRVVSSLSDLEASSAGAIIIDASTIGDLTSDWLSQRYDSGTVLMALNFPGEELKAKVGGTAGSFGTAPDADHAADGPLAGVPYATIIWRTPDALYPKGGFNGGQYHIDLDRTDPDALLRRIEVTIRDATEGPGVR